MKAFFRIFMAITLLGTQISCLPASQQGGASILSCSSNGVEQEVYGKWKKLTGYGPDQEEGEDLDDDFDIMIIPQGNHMCEAKIVNKAQVTDEARYHATFEHSLRNQTLDLVLTAVGRNTGLSKGATRSIDYSLSCNGRIPTLRFQDSNGDVQTFQIWSRTVGINDCGPNPDPRSRTN